MGIIQGVHKVYHNLSPAQLIEMAVLHREGKLTSTGALAVKTGKYTGRSPHDKFIVDLPSIHQNIDWSRNQPFSEHKFIGLYNRMMAYMQNREVYVFDGYAGADEAYRLNVRFVNEYAWQNLFVHQLFVRPTPNESFQPNFKVICLPGFKAVPEIDGTRSEVFVIINFDRRLVLIGGTQYAGEIKKSIFSVMNYLLPQKGVLSMHCSANVGKNEDTALFFGLSGTGKTTLSADPDRSLIGDDEHGWSSEGIFNIEGGCYAKCIRLRQETEPQIWEAICHGSVLENVVVEPMTRIADFDSEDLTENTRVAYPVEHIPHAVIPGLAGHPKTILFLTADAFGVLPPIAKLSKEQAMYHFLSGYTSKLAGTERGITDPEATFSACFGAPFLPLSPFRYAELLGQKLEEYNTQVFLVNTGWSGGGYGTGQRIKLAFTRAMVSAALNGVLNDVEYVTDPIFNLAIPTYCPDVPSEVLQPKSTWLSSQEYDQKASELARLFVENFEGFQSDQFAHLAQGGPRLHF